MDAKVYKESQSVTCTLARGVPNLEEIGFLPYAVDLSEFVSSFDSGTVYTISHCFKVNI